MCSAGTSTAPLAMLRARWPEYRESKELELSGAVGGEPVKLVVSPFEAGL